MIIMAELVKTYYENGQLESEVYVINGKKNGSYKRILHIRTIKYGKLAHI